MFLFFLLSSLIYCNINYASSSIGAYVIESYPSLKHANNLLSSNPDNYLYALCKPTSITIKLIDRIQITSIELQNCEWLSNFVTKIMVYITDEDKCIGQFNLNPTRNKIKINVPESEYTSIVRIVFLEFIGSHEIFTLTHLKIYGRTFMDDLINKRVKECRNIRDNRSGEVSKRKYEDVKINFEKKKKYKNIKFFAGITIFLWVIFLIRRIKKCYNQKCKIE